jgi:hypothetical protein
LAAITIISQIFFIIGATPLFLLAAACLAKRAAIRPTGATTPARNYSRARAPIAALATTALVMIVALGAGHHGRLIRPAHAAVKWCQSRCKIIAEHRSGFVVGSRRCACPAPSRS